MNTDDQQHIRAIRARGVGIEPENWRADQIEVAWLLDLVERQQRALSELQARLEAEHAPKS